MGTRKVGRQKQGQWLTVYDEMKLAQAAALLPKSEI